MTAFYLGIDVGKSGGAAVISASGKLILNDQGKPYCIKFGSKKYTERSASRWFKEIMDLTDRDISVALEKTRPRFDRGGSISQFKIGQSYGFLRGILAAHEIPYAEVSPQKWQRALDCLSGGDKKVTRARAHRQWPKHSDNIGHAIADALLIAEWLRRQEE